MESSLTLLTDNRTRTKAKARAITAIGVGMAYQSKAGSFQALKSINLQVQQGDIQILMGPSGSGKTTLLSILAGILTPTEGSVFLFEEEITKFSKQKLAQFRLHNIGFIFQGFNLFPALSAAENVGLILQLVAGFLKSDLNID